MNAATNLETLPISPKLTETEVVKITRISPVTLRRWRMERKGPRFLKLGGRVVYDLDDLRTWMDAARRGGDAA